MPCSIIIFFLCTLTPLYALPNFPPLSVPIDSLIHHIKSGGARQDEIPAMNNPLIVEPAQALYLNNDDLILGVVINGQARAYPHSLGWNHEIINDRLGGRYIAVTFCPLTSTGLVFDATDNQGAQIKFGVSGLLINSNLVMFDRSNNTLYPQMIFTGINGPDKGRTLKLLPVVETTWGLWQQLHPSTSIVQAATGLAHYADYIRNVYQLKNYQNYPYDDYRTNHFLLMFLPTTAPYNQILPAKEIILGLLYQEYSKAYPLSRMPDGAVINDRLGDQPLLIIFDAANHTAIPYKRRLQERLLTFYRVPATTALPIEFMDRETHSRWNMHGKAIDGPLQGEHLEPMASYNAMWFGWSAYWPTTQLWDGEGLIEAPDE